MILHEYNNQIIYNEITSSISLLGNLVDFGI